MAASAPVSVGTANSAVSSTSLVIPVSTVPPLGSTVFFGGRFNAAQTSATISDGTANVYTVRVPSTSQNEFFGEALVVADMTGANATVTGNASATAKIGVGWYCTGIDPFSSIREEGQVGAVPIFQGTARNIGGNTLTPTMIDGIIFGLWSLDTTETSFTAGSGYTVGPTWTGTGYYTALTLSVEMVYQIITATGAKQPLATGGASPTAYGAASFLYKSARTMNPLAIRR